MAQFVEYLDVKPTQPNFWHLRIVLPTETVEGDVHLSGTRTSMNRPEPGYSTLPFAGDHAAYFLVITYFGHRQQPASGEWRAHGSGTFTDTLTNVGDNLTLGTSFEDRWQARSGLYKFVR